MPSQADAVSQDATDGRRERTQVTRRNILTAARELILEGDFDPTAETIAARTDVTRRTLFRHFPDMETLHREILRDALAYAHTVMEEPFPPCQTHWSELLETVITRRVRIYEYLLPLQVSVVYQRFRATQGPELHREDVQRRRKRLKEILPAAMKSDPLLFEALDATLSIEFWITLRRDRQLSVKRATEVLRHAVTRITV
jgi:AcrR family transcriptional regulator